MTGSTAGRASDSSKGGIDRAVFWSVMLQMLAVPLIFILLIGVALVASSIGVELGGKDDRAIQYLLIGGYVAAVLLPLVASVVVGLFGWRRRRRRGALAAAVTSAFIALLFLLVAAALV